MRKNHKKKLSYLVFGALLLSGCGVQSENHQETTKEGETVMEIIDNSTEKSTSEDNTEESINESETTQPDEKLVLVECIDATGLKDYEKYRLQDIPLITESIASGSFGLGQLDSSNTYAGNPVLKVPSSNGTIVVRDWNTSDISAYTANGEISFLAKAEGKGSITLGLQDHNLERSQTEYESYITVEDISEEWSKVSIPLKDFYAGEEKLDEKCIWTLKLRASGEVYICDMRITSTDAETVYPTVKVNQVGYLPDSEKIALASGFREILLCDEDTDFFVIDAKTQQKVLTGKMKLVTDYDEHSGEAVYSMNFSELNSEGEYQIYFTDGNGLNIASTVFSISDKAYDTLLIDACRYYYFQRANVDLLEENAGEWAREGLYKEDYDMAFLSDKSKTRDVSGGWFDAGDFGKYVDPGASAVNDLLWTYHFFPDAFYDGQNNIPESGNGIPDILDEIRVELDFILKMQDKSDGGFYHRVNPDDSKRAIVDTFGNDGGNVKATSATASSSAVLAFASVYFDEYDSEYSWKLLEAARQGFKYIQDNPDIQSTGTYGTEKVEGQKLWAACGLFYATGEEEYHDYIKAHSDVFSAGFNTLDFGHGSDHMEKMAFFIYLLCDNTDSTIIEKYSEKYSKWRDAMLNNINQNPWQTALPTWGYWWGSNSNAMGVAMEIYIGDRLLGFDNEKSAEVIQRALDYILGVNPLSLSYVTGEGERSISCTYSGIFGRDGLEGFPPGYAPGGVNSYDNWIVSVFPAKCYDDSSFDWVSNENAIYYNSPLVFLASACGK